MAYHRRQNDFVVRPQSVFLCRRTWASNDKVVQVQRHVALHMTIGEKDRVIIVSSIKRNHSLPHFHGGFSKRRKSGRELTYLEESRYPGFQVFHDVPIIRSRQVQISVGETYPFQQDVQEFRDIIASDIQNDPGQRGKYHENGASQK